MKMNIFHMFHSKYHFILIILSLMQYRNKEKIQEKNTLLIDINLKKYNNLSSTKRKNPVKFRYISIKLILLILFTTIHMIIYYYSFLIILIAFN